MLFCLKTANTASALSNTVFLSAEGLNLFDLRPLSVVTVISAVNLYCSDRGDMLMLLTVMDSYLRPQARLNLPGIKADL
jgi:hypothetical protein